MLTQNYWVSGLCLSSGILNTRTLALMVHFGSFILPIYVYVLVLGTWLQDGYVAKIITAIWIIVSLRACSTTIFTAYFLVTFLRLSQSQSHVTTDGQSVSMSWCQVHSGTCDQILFTVWNLLCCLCGAPTLRRGRVCLLSVSVSSI
jgi:hypothetical protein